MQCSWYAFRCSIQPFLMSLTTQRGSRSTQKQMPPRYWAQVLDGQAQPARAGRPEHQPVAPFREELLRQRVGEHLVVDPEVVDDDAALGDAGRAAGLEDVDAAIGVSAFGTQRRTGPPRSQSSSKKRELLEVVEAVDVLERVELERLRLLQPERRAGVGTEVPADDLADLGVELNAGVLDLFFERCAATGLGLPGVSFTADDSLGGAIELDY